MKTLLTILIAAILTVSASAQTYSNIPNLVARFECPPAPNQGTINLVIPDLAYFYAAISHLSPSVGVVTGATLTVDTNSGTGALPMYSQFVTPNITGETFIPAGIQADTTISYTVSIVYHTANANIRYNTTVHQPHEGWWIQGTGGFNLAPASGYLGCANITPVPAGASQSYWYNTGKGNGNGNNGNGKGKGGK